MSHRWRAASIAGQKPRTRREARLLWSLVARDGEFMLMDKPFRVTFRWPDGQPLSLKTDHQLRTYARRVVAEIDGVPMTTAAGQRPAWTNSGPSEEMPS